MKEILEKLNKTKDSILAEKKDGLFYFFGLLERTDLENKWDIVISANWIKENNSVSDLEYVINKLKKEFEGNFDFVSKIILLSPRDAFINDLGWAIQKSQLLSGEEIFSLKISDEIAIKHLFVVAKNFDTLSLIKPIETLKQTEAANSF